MNLRVLQKKKSFFIIAQMDKYRTNTLKMLTSISNK